MGASDYMVNIVVYVNGEEGSVRKLTKLTLSPVNDISVPVVNDPSTRCENQDFDTPICINAVEQIPCTSHIHLLEKLGGSTLMHQVRRGAMYDNVRLCGCQGFGHIFAGTHTSVDVERSFDAVS
jgi:hypothetical protein